MECFIADFLKNFLAQLAKFVLRVAGCSETLLKLINFIEFH